MKLRICSVLMLFFAASTVYGDYPASGLFAASKGYDVPSNPNGRSGHPSVSKNGRYIAFDSAASNLVAVDINNSTDVFVYDTVLLSKFG